MKRALFVLSAFVSLSLLACGGSTVEAEPLGETSQELVTCSATCPGGQTVSCTGNTCSATENSGVTCNGVFTACPSGCTGLPACSGYENQRCFERLGTRLDCCQSWGPDYLVCSSVNGFRYWLYQ